jgi:hypothetical protein
MALCGPFSSSLSLPSMLRGQHRRPPPLRSSPPCSPCGPCSQLAPRCTSSWMHSSLSPSAAARHPSPCCGPTLWVSSRRIYALCRCQSPSSLSLLSVSPRSRPSSGIRWRAVFERAQQTLKNTSETSWTSSRRPGTRGPARPTLRAW